MLGGEPTAVPSPLVRCDAAHHSFRNLFSHQACCSLVMLRVIKCVYSTSYLVLQTLNRIYSYCTIVRIYNKKSSKKTLVSSAMIHLNNIGFSSVTLLMCFCSILPLIKSVRLYGNCRVGEDHWKLVSLFHQSRKKQ